MRISQEADYALRIVGHLSKTGEGKRCDAKSIARDAHLPQRFAVKILRKLNLAGITKSYRGAYGGYAVNRNPADITFLEVVECIDGPLYINKCLMDIKKCSDGSAGNCITRKRLQVINTKICEMLKESNFSDYMEK